MTLKLEEYEKLKKRADKLRTDAERAKGALDQLTSKLREDYDCVSLEDAKELLEKLRGEEEEAETVFEEALAGFEEEWGDKLEEMG